MKTWWPTSCLQHTVPLRKINHLLTSTSVFWLQAAGEEMHSSPHPSNTKHGFSQSIRGALTDCSRRVWQTTIVQKKTDTNIHEVLKNSVECSGNDGMMAPAVRCAFPTIWQEILWLTYGRDHSPNLSI